MFDNIPLRVRRKSLGAFVAGLAVAVVAAVIATRPGAVDEAAADEPSDVAIASVAVLVPDERMDPRLLGLELRGVAWDRAVGRLDDALFAHTDNERKLARAEELLAQLGDEAVLVHRALRAVVDESDSLADELAAVEAILQARALDRYVSFGADPLLGLEDPSDSTDAARSAELGRRLDEVQFSTRTELLGRIDAVDVEQRRLLGRGVELAAEVASTEVVVHDRRAAVDELAREVEAATDAVRAARWSATVPGTDLSVVALDAYLNAEELLSGAWGACNIEWSMIAGVARIESRHGRYGGRTLQADGRVDRPIIGIALDGSPGVRAMVDTDDGEYDGDTVWDRAVGPLQFIPETWLRRGRDGNGDGWADPQNIYDAAYSSGRYLCALGGDLSNRAALRSAYFGYNNSTAYVDDVIGHADRYAGLSLADPPPAVVETVENPGEVGD